ncbi:MAG: Hsp20/alpha crystallin family protein [Candidatus Dormibacteraeota bacterium]|nr:Hsp20/alpha crystallin family protein [Candidatus Dormibacteraeota bacterium]
MRFVYNDPYALRGAVEQLAGQHPTGTRRERDIPIPVDIYQEGNEIVIEGALAGAELKDLELTCEAGLLTVWGSVAPVDRDFAVQEIPRGTFSRTLALPAECELDNAKASFENGIIRIVLPRPRERVAHTIKVESGKSDASSRIVMEKPEVLDAVKGQGYREVGVKSNRRKARSK